MKKFSFKVKYAAISIGITLALVAGLILINVIFEELDITFDMTRRDLYTLTDETENLLASLDDEVTLYYLSKPGSENMTVKELLQQYAAHRRVKLEIVDPDRNPALVARYTESSGDGDTKTISVGSVIVVSGERSRVVPSIDLYNISYTEEGGVNVYGFKAEQSISAAVQYAATGKQVIVYQLVGHDEYTFEDLTYAENLEKSNFTLNTLNMTTAAGIPDDADIAVIISPSWDYSRNETEKLRAFLDRGGSLYVALDLVQEELDNLRTLLAAWNISVKRGIVMEQDADRLIPEFGSSPLVFTPEFAYEDITGPLTENNQSMILSTAVGISEPEIGKRNIEFIPVLQSSAKSWLRVDLTAPSQNRVMSDISGPVVVAAAAAEKSMDTGFHEGAKILVIGSAQSFTPLSGIGSLKANFDFTVSAMGWLAGTGSMINIQSRSLYRLPLQLSALQAFIYAGVVVIVIPIGIIVAGLIVYLRRKRL